MCFSATSCSVKENRKQIRFQPLYSFTKKQRAELDKHETSLVEVMTRIMNQTSWQVRPRTAGCRRRAMATCRFCTDATVHLNTYHENTDRVINNNNNNTDNF